jgi:hypothetical protein
LSEFGQQPGEDDEHGYVCCKSKYCLSHLASY